jgi:hypothetical protein
LNDQQGAPDTQRPTDPPKPSWLSRAVGNVRRYREHRRAEKKKHAPADRAAISTARATWFIAVLTLVTAGAAISQYIIFDRQLKVMQGQLDIMLRDEEPKFTVTDKLAGPLFQPASAAGDVGYVSWSIPYINSGKGAAFNQTIDTYISLDYGPFVRSNAALRPEPIRADEISAGESHYFTINSQLIRKDQFDVIRAKELAIAAFADFTYFDRLDRKYTFGWCMRLFANGAIAHPNASECRKSIQK